MRPHDEKMASCITFPEIEWQGRSFDELFSPLEFDHPEHGRVRQPTTWKIGESRSVDFASLGRIDLRDVGNFVHWPQKITAKEKARDWFAQIKAKGFYKYQK